MNCEMCNRPLPPSSDRRGQRFCGATCRKRASRAAAGAVTATEGPVTAAVRAVLAEIDHGGSIDAARGEMAVALARLTDGGSVPAARELRGVLSDLALIEDEDVAAFRALVQTPSRPMPPDAA